MVENPHQPTCNQPVEPHALVKETRSRPPYSPAVPSAAQRQAQLRDGVEYLEGYVRPTRKLLAAEEWAAPSALLPDIGQASFGPPPDPAETVHGPDDRAQVSDTTSYPWRVHASLLITANDSSTWLGTAWFISAQTLATAGHCVYINNSGVPGRDGWVRSIQVMPGRDGDKLPYGFVTSTVFHAAAGWTDSGDENYDYAALVIPTDLGNTTGWLGLGTWPDAALLATIGNISGYPCDKPNGTEWFASRQISSVTPTKVYYDIDTAGGQSGSAVYRDVDGERYSVAIHAYGGNTVNSGTRITPEVYDNLSSWSA
ncbi:trypsin-like serine peptidase [Streptomyces sp. NPDC056347]|uniref:trypsin-like serine peptidase n=1 Tax=Streptomyces sp. NPDC056347 TaxID=3345790 RepID=UPI0035E3797E